MKRRSRFLWTIRGCLIDTKRVVACSDWAKLRAYRFIAPASCTTPVSVKAMAGYWSELATALAEALRFDPATLIGLRALHASVNPRRPSSREVDEHADKYKAPENCVHLPGN